MARDILGTQLHLEIIIIYSIIIHINMIYNIFTIYITRL